MGERIVSARERSNEDGFQIPARGDWTVRTWSADLVLRVLYLECTKTLRWGWRGGSGRKNTCCTGVNTYLWIAPSLWKAGTDGTDHRLLPQQYGEWRQDLLAARTSSGLSERLCFKGRRWRDGEHATPPPVSELSPAHTYVSAPHTDEHNTLKGNKNEPTSWVCKEVVMGFVQWVVWAGFPWTLHGDTLIAGYERLQTWEREPGW